MISVNDRVCEGFPQCDLNVALALPNAPALPDQEHELIHKGRNRSHFARQRALHFDAMAALNMGSVTDSVRRTQTRSAETWLDRR